MTCESVAGEVGHADRVQHTKKNKDGTGLVQVRFATDLPNPFRSRSVPRVVPLTYVHPSMV